MISDATRSGSVFGRRAAHHPGHAALLTLGRHSSLRTVGDQPAQDLPPCE